MEKKVIKTDADYSAALATIERLMDQDPEPGTAEANNLELFALLVQDYESKRFPTSIPDPLTAIRFRMEQQNLSPRDLVPYIGSRSKVSEVLSGKRPLTLTMIRAIHSGLGVPAKVLLRDRGSDFTEEDNNIQWDRFPIRELVKRGWIAAKATDVGDRAQELMQRFFAPIGIPNLVAARYLKREHIRSARTMDRYALATWSARILIRASERPSPEFKPGTVNLEFMREVARLSWSAMGPLLAREFLEAHGIELIIEPHLPRTFLDGAAMMSDAGRPVIGLTLRHDRLDNFWFVLLHELGHVSKHLAGGIESFFDDLDTSSLNDRKEREADQLAGEALIPASEWAKSPAKSLPSPEAAEHLAKELNIHPAIVAGRIRYERRNFRILHQVVGLGEVRRLFPETRWS